MVGDLDREDEWVTRVARLYGVEDEEEDGDGDGGVRGSFCF